MGQLYKIITFPNHTIYIPIELFLEHFSWDTKIVYDEKLGEGKVTPWCVEKKY